jgi:hypothetical protein
VRADVANAWAEVPKLHNDLLMYDPVAMLNKLLRPDERVAFIDAASFGWGPPGLIVLTDDRLLYVKAHRLRHPKVMTIPVAEIIGITTGVVAGKGWFRLQLRNPHGLLRRRHREAVDVDPPERVAVLERLLKAGTS